MNSLYGKLLLFFFLLISQELLIGQTGEAQGEYVSLVCVHKDGKYGFLDDSGQEVIPCKFDNPSSFSEGRVALKQGKNWSYYDASGKKVLDLRSRFAYCGEFHDGVAFVSEKPIKKTSYPNKPFWRHVSEELQYIDRVGKVIFKVDNEWRISSAHLGRDGFSDGLLKVRKEREPDSFEVLYGYLNKSGKLTLPFKYRAENNVSAAFSEGMADMGMREYLPNRKEPVVRYGYIDKMGDWSIPPKYSLIYPFKYGVAMVSDTVPNSKYFTRYFMIDKEDNLIFPEGVETYPRKVRDSLLAVFKVERTESGGAKSSTQRSAIAKVDGSMITDYRFVELHPGKVSGDLWRASLPEDSKTIGYVDDKGEVVIPYQYGWGSLNFEYGLAIVRMREEGHAKAVINVKGEFVIPPDASANFQMSGGTIICNDATGWKYYNRLGQVISLGDYTVCGPFQYLAVSSQ